MVIHWLVRLESKDEAESNEDKLGCAESKDEDAGSKAGSNDMLVDVEAVDIEGPDKEMKANDGEGNEGEGNEREGEAGKEGGESVEAGADDNPPATRGDGIESNFASSVKVGDDSHDKNDEG